ncbi:MAG: metal-dependent hydrolase [Synechococcaceae cyanobacterium RM1_1_27]|nr:metal-dependent hydrolase [Synechococcaceae cyanobacterium RM1_1_27]
MPPSPPAAASLTLGSSDPVILAAAALTSQLPDVDTTKSTTGLVLYPVARWFEDRYPHRSVTHSFAATAAVAVALLPLAFWLGWQMWSALVIGYFAGWFLDSFTKSGVEAFYPSRARMVIPGNPRARMAPGSTAEYWVLAIALIAMVININLLTAGGAVEVFARSFILNANTASEQFRRNGSDQQVWVKVDGIHNITNARINAEFKVVSAPSENSVIAEDPSGVLYQIGSDSSSQIKANSINVRLGDPITITSSESTPQNVFLLEWLRSIPQNAFISGSLLLEDMSEIRLPLSVDRFATLKIYGGQVELINARPSEVIGSIGDQYILAGKVNIKVRSDG